MAEDTRIVISAIDRTSKGFKSVGAGLGRITKSIFSMKTALVGVAGVAGFAYLVKSSLNSADALAKTASKIGTTTEALSKLQYAAGITGVETNTLNMAMQRFTRRAAEAAQGTGEAKGAIRELGLDAKKLQQLPLDEQMKVLADAFKTVETDADKLRIAFKMFDSEGAALVNTLALGSEGLDKLFGRAESLGIVLSGSAAAGAAKANDAISDLLSIVRGLTLQFSAALAPVIEFAATKFTNFILTLDSTKEGINGVGQAMAVGFIDGLIKAVKGMQKFANNTIKVANTVYSAFRRFFPDSVEQDLSDKIDKLSVKMRGIAMAAQGGMGFDTALYKEIELQRKVLIEQLDKMRSETKDISLIDLDKTIATLEEFKSKVGEIPDAVQNAFEPAAISLNSFEKGVKSFSDSIPSMEENLKSLTDQGLNGLTDALTAGVTGAAKFSDAMKSMAKSVVDSLIKMLIQKYIVDAAFGAITGYIGGTQTGINAQGGYGASLGSRDPFDTSSFKAIGGSVQAGQPYMVGERGQEMFVPNQSGSIIPNNKMGGGSGVVVNQTINISTGVAQTVRAEVANLMPQIASAAKGAVADARQRGGGYSQALIGA
jgi:hypothetical protein|tara:strand:+ start:826 stop:2625 length:1800 start_codon:yes stop_codon:yes gene_type:complete